MTSEVILTFPLICFILTIFCSRACVRACVSHHLWVGKQVGGGKKALAMLCYECHSSQVCLQGITKGSTFVSKYMVHLIVKYSSHNCAWFISSQCICC